MKVFNVISTAVFLSVAGTIAYKLISADNEYYATVNPQIRTIEEKTRIPGNVYPIKEIEIKSQISGILEDIKVKVGDFVVTNQPVATIKLVPNSSDVENLRSNVELTRITYENRTNEYERAKTLFDKKVIAKAEFESIEKEFSQVTEQYRTAQNLYNISSRGYTDGSDMANVVKSSTNGTIIDIPIEEGASVIERNNYNQGTTVAVLAAMNRFVFRAQVAEQYLRYISYGTKVTLTFNAYDSLQVVAQVTKVSAKGTQVNGVMRYTIDAEFEITDSMPTIRSGYSATAEFVLNRRDSVVAIEERFIRFSGDTAYVNTKDTNTNKPYRVYINTGISDGVFCEVTDGLNVRDNVITRDIDKDND